MKLVNKQVNYQEIALLLEQQFSSNVHIDLIGLATTDGFNIHSIQTDKTSIEFDKLAAISSSIYALSNASAKQIIGHDLNITTVETAEGYLLFLKTQHKTQACVLTVLAKPKMQLGEARYIALRLAKSIQQL